MNLSSQIIFLFLIIALTWRESRTTCVLDSDFGFAFNCQFKKSGLFRVRNLGGVKGYVGVGFSVGDELGFKQSLSNLEGNKRRSLSSSSAALSGVSVADTYSAVAKKSADKTNNIRSTSLLRSTQLATVPPFKPIPFEDSSTPLKPVVAVPGYVIGPLNKEKGIQMVAGPNFGTSAAVPQFQALPASISKIASAAAASVKAQTAFKSSLQQATGNFQTPAGLSAHKLSHRTPNHHSASPQIVNVVQIDRSSNSNPVKVLPTAIPVPNAISTEEKKPSVTLDSQAMSETIKTLSQASNVSEEAIAAAINMRQQQLLSQQTKPKVVTTTTTTTTTERVFTTEPAKKYPLSGPSKVMNAPKEYYPVGYDKNFDDNFVSRVELPDTSFYCGEQKHFPGLYADEDLGCMVFHVCAFTDDGLIMKSFLCPESTLFDQTILKCNWWFYVDCKASRKLYDSNIPISKSYQLMKALAFFSTYNKPS